MTPPKKHGLGRGLSGLIAGAKGVSAASGPKASVISGASKPAVAAPQTPFREVAVAKISASPHQARREFDEEGIRQLADSIRSEGLLQPLVVRAKGDRYLLIAGERRLRACQSIGLKTVPVCVLDVGEASSAVMGLIENLQRRDLNPIETALAYASLMKDFGLTQEAVAERVAQPRASVANMLRLLALDREIQGFLVKGAISVGHAKVLLGIEDAQMRQVAAREIIKESLSVRETEILAARLKRDSGRKLTRNTPAQAQSAVILDLEKRLSGKLNTRVSLKHGSKHGKIVIEYFGNEDLQRILERLGLA